MKRAVDDVMVANDRELEELPASWNLRAACHFFLSGNHLRSVDERLRQAVTLDLSRNFLEQVDLTGFHSLTKLNLDGNRIRALYLHDLPELVTVSVRSCGMYHLRCENLPQLTALTAAENNIDEIEMTQCPTLFTLDLSHNQLKALPTSSARSLNVSYNPLVLEPMVDSPLEFLVADHIRPLEELHSEWFSDHLTALCLRHNEIQRVRGCFVGLESLCLDGNRLETLDISKSTLPDCQRLYVADNQLKQLVYGNGNGSLLELCAARNQLRSFDVKMLPRLAKLVLIHNNLQTFKTDGSQLVALDLTHNPLRQFEQSTPHDLEYLHSLHLRGTRLETIELTGVPAIREVVVNDVIYTLRARVPREDEDPEEKQRGGVEPAQVIDDGFVFRPEIVMRKAEDLDRRVILSAHEKSGTSLLKKVKVDGATVFSAE